MAHSLTLHNACATTETRSHIKYSWKHATYQCSRRDAAKYLNEEQECASQQWESTDEAHAHSDSWIEESTRDSEEHPGVDGQTEAKAK